MTQVIIYTDGSALGNPGPGGWGAVLLWGDLRREMSGGYARTTNNRMELMAVIRALEALKFPCEVTLRSDSTYVVHAVEKGWLMQWEQERFKKKKNADLWLKFLPLYRRHSVRFVWVRGHTNVPENERCDRLAVAAANRPDLPPDVGYEE